MKRFWLFSIVGLIACDASREPQAQPWTVEETSDPASHIEPVNELRTFPFQESSESAFSSKAPEDKCYNFELTDPFNQPEKPIELHYLSARRGAGIETVWLRLPKEVLGFEAAFECPATSGTVYSRVRVAPGIEVSCIIGRTRSFLNVVFSGVEERWDHTDPRIAIGLTPDDMLYEWRLIGMQDLDFQEVFHFYYNVAEVHPEDGTYGGYRL
jgi:hypothetical protein